MAKTGRPPGPEIVFTDEQIAEIERMSAIRLVIKDMAAILGVSKSTFERRLNDDPRVSEAVNKGRAKAMARAHAWAYREAFENNNTTMAIFWLKTQARWRDVSLTQEENEGLKPIVNFILKGGSEVDDETIRNKIAAAYDKPQVVTIDVEPVKAS